MSTARSRYVFLKEYRDRRREVGFTTRYYDSGNPFGHISHSVLGSGWSDKERAQYTQWVHDYDSLTIPCSPRLGLVSATRAPATARQRPYECAVGYVG